MALEHAPSANGRGYDGFLASRPRGAENLAIAEVIEAARGTGGRLHILHLSSADALPMIRSAGRDGLRLTAEVCPHYLIFAAEEIPDGATEFKCCPPIREAANRDELWAAVADGTIDVIVSDHSPCTPELKRLDIGDFAAAWGGISSLQLGLPAIWTEARRRGHSLTEVIRWMAERPAAQVALDRGPTAHPAPVVGGRAAGDPLGAAGRSAADRGVCPHYLIFAAEEIPDGATEFKCCPPIRESANRDELWAAVGDGTIDFIVSDHSPCTPELKRLDIGDFAAAWGGISSLQLGLPAIWTEARRRGHSLTDVIGWMAVRPAAQVGLDQKGSIAVGKDADFAVFAPDETLVVEPNLLYHKHAVTPYAGRRLTGRVRSTWLRGTDISADVETNRDRRGRLLRRGEV